MSARLPESVLSAGGDSLPPDGGVIELTLLLPSAQVTALERAARRKSLTLGQMVRRLIRDFLAHPTANVGDGEASPPDSSRLPDQQKSFP